MNETPSHIRSISGNRCSNGCYRDTWFCNYLIGGTNLVTRFSPIIVVRQSIPAQPFAVDRNKQISFCFSAHHHSPHLGRKYYRFKRNMRPYCLYRLAITHTDGIVIEPRFKAAVGNACAEQMLPNWHRETLTFLGTHNAKDSVIQAQHTINGSITLY